MHCRSLANHSLRVVSPPPSEESFQKAQKEHVNTGPGSIWDILSRCACFMTECRTSCVCAHDCACMSIDHRSPCPVLYSSGTKVTTVVPLSYVDCLVQLGLIFPGYSRMSDRSCRKQFETTSSSGVEPSWGFHKWG